MNLWPRSPHDFIAVYRVEKFGVFEYWAGFCRSAVNFYVAFLRAIPQLIGLVLDEPNCQDREWTVLSSPSLTLTKRETERETETNIKSSNLFLFANNCDDNWLLAQGVPCCPFTCCCNQQWLLHQSQLRAWTVIVPITRYWWRESEERSSMCRNVKIPSVDANHGRTLHGGIRALKI